MATFIDTHRDRLLYQALLLGSACFAVSLLLLIGNASTSTTIEKLITHDKQVLLTQVLPAELYDNNPLAEAVVIDNVAGLAQPVTLYIARKHNAINGAGILAAIQGWGGQVNFILGVNNSGEITGVRIISHKETPGLADKIEIEKSPWITEFEGKSLVNTSQPQWAVKKDGGTFDQFTGATITPRAVVKGIHLALVTYQQWRQAQVVRAPTEEQQ